MIFNVKNLAIKLFLISALFLGCSRVETLNLNDHTYGTRPRNIIWFQIAGLQEEHLSMLRFNAPQSFDKTAFEQVSCMGKMWNYNLYGLRPSADKGFLSQIVGSKNIKGTCEDYDKKPLWSYLNSSSYKIGIFESSAGKGSLEASRACDNQANFLNDAILWKMEKNNSKQVFHYLGKENFSKGQTYYDKSCQKSGCFATIFDNIKSVWKRFKKDPGQTLFIIRDFSYLNALENKNIGRAREILLELNKSLAYFYEELDIDKKTLFLISSSAAMNIEMPREGKEWYNFEKKGKHVLFRNTSLVSPVMARGPGAENFCGFFEESEVVKRIFWRSEKKTWSPFDVF